MFDLVAKPPIRRPPVGPGPSHERKDYRYESTITEYLPLVSAARNNRNLKFAPIISNVPRAIDRLLAHNHASVDRCRFSVRVELHKLELLSNKRDNAAAQVPSAGAQHGSVTDPFKIVEQK